jgi:predicted dehydrogenase
LAAAAGAPIQIVAALDTNPTAGEGTGIPVVEDWAMLRERAGPLDFVDICTPTGSHVSATLQALSQGYHVLCEKPAAITQSDALAVAAAARKARRSVVPCHQYRFNPAWQQIRRWIDDGAIGTWHLAEIAVYRAAADAGAGATDVSGVPWRGLRRDGAGGILLDHGTHWLYALLDVGGLPRSVHAWAGRLRHRRYDVEDTAQVVLEYPDRIATLFVTWAAHHRENRLRFIGDRGTIEWTAGNLRLDAGDQKISLDMTAQLDKSAYPSWFAALFQSFTRTLDAGGTAEAPLADVARVAVLLDAAYQAAERAAAVAVPQISV